MRRRRWPVAVRSTAGEETNVARLTRELNEALEQQTATSEVLKVISGSPGDLEPVFAAMLENAVRICDAKFGNIYRLDGDALCLVATHNTPSAFAEARRRSPWCPNPKIVLGRMVATKTVVHTADLAAEPVYIEQHHPAVVEAVELGRVRTLLAVPMLKENELIGAFSLSRQEVRPFTDKQIALVTNFAAQAVIAIENARLLNELRQRTADLAEALEQQTATAEVLRVISSSPGDLQPVFGTLLENAVRICDARFGNLLLVDGSGMRIVAMHNAPPAFDELRRCDPFIDLERSFAGPLVTAKQVIHLDDLAAEEPHASSALAKVAGARTALAVPMLREDDLVGAITIYRQEVRPFTEKQIALVQNFADQAVIAIANTRLLSELKQSLEQQTATSEVLQVISSSPGDLQPVFATMLEKAVRICDATFGNVYRWDGDALHLVATHNTPPAFTEARRRAPYRPSPKTPAGRMLAAKSVIHVADMAAEEAYADRNPTTVAAVELGGVRTYLAVPMLKDNVLIGLLSLSRQEVRPFNDKEITLVQNFAAQAVIAIENTRLLNELRETLQQQTATADVLKVISRSTFDLDTVLATLSKSAAELCDASQVRHFYARR